MMPYDPKQEWRMQAKTERFELRLEPRMLRNVDTWRAQQPDLPNRTEAIRRLVDAGLSAGDKRRVRLSDGERLIALMLCDVVKHLNIGVADEPDFVKAALGGGHHWALKSQFGGIFHGHDDDPGAVEEVGNILEMWWFMEQSYKKLSEAEQSRVAVASGDSDGVKFRGFDGNNESEHLSIAKFLVDRMDRFPDLKDRVVNSHMPRLDGYRRMLPVFAPMRERLGGGNLLDADDLIELLNAGRGR